MTNTERIFQLNTPYDNPYQGSTKRLLFVCSAGLLRSPTGATVGAKMGFNTRSCGSNYRYALVPISANLVYWANTIYFLNMDNYTDTLGNFYLEKAITTELNSKKVVLEIEDEFNYMDPKLVAQFEKLLKETT